VVGSHPEVAGATSEGGSQATPSPNPNPNFFFKFFLKKKLKFLIFNILIFSY
jgi:hypothetical protein